MTKTIYNISIKHYLHREKKSAADNVRAVTKISSGKPYRLYVHRRWEIKLNKKKVLWILFGFI